VAPVESGGERGSATGAPGGNADPGCIGSNSPSSFSC